MLHQFAGSAQGASPEAPLSEPANGIFYGVTTRGGSRHVGTLFRLERDSGKFEILHSFAGQPNDGASPAAALTIAREGFLVGVTPGGGRLGRGMIFLFDARARQLIPLHSFTGADTDGLEPSGPLLRGSDGMFYGVTASGGGHAQGTLYRVQLTGLP